MKSSVLVGDIGSTKSTWYYGNGMDPVHLHGYNPIVHPLEVGKQMFYELHQVTKSFTFDEIWYYGTGVTDPQIANQVKEIIRRDFSHPRIHVLSDLEGACSAGCGDKPGTVAILGTGSHAALWDGMHIIRQAVSLGYLLGDEGSGCDIGKELVRSYFYGEMPEEIREDMAMRKVGSRTDFLTALKASTTPNQFLADFARVADQHRDHDWIKSMVSNRFRVFTEKHLLPLQPVSAIHIIGSIGCIFAGLLTAELAKAGLRAGRFIPDPARRLFEKHITKI